MSDFELAVLFVLSIIMACHIYIALRVSDINTAAWSMARRLDRWESCLFNVSRKIREDE